MALEPAVRLLDRHTVGFQRLQPLRRAVIVPPRIDKEYRRQKQDHHHGNEHDREELPRDKGDDLGDDEDAPFRSVLEDKIQLLDDLGHTVNIDTGPMVLLRVAVPRKHRKILSGRDLISRVIEILPLPHKNIGIADADAF